MQNLLVWTKNKDEFNTARIKAYLPKIFGVKEVKDISNSSETMSLEWEFDYKDDSTIVTLHKDSSTISMQGLGDASLQMAFELQQKESFPLRVYDEGYSFHFSLENISSLEDMKKKIAEDYFDKEALAMEATTN